MYLDSVTNGAICLTTTNAWTFMNSGVPRHICSNLLGACSLFLHLRGNPCLWKSTCHSQVKPSFSLLLCNLRSKGYLLYVSLFVGSVTDQKPFTLWCATISLRVLDIILYFLTLIQNVLDVCRGRRWSTSVFFSFSQQTLKKLIPRFVEEDVGQVWEDGRRSRNIDRTMLICFLTLYLLFNCIYWPVWLHHWILSHHFESNIY